MIPFAFGLATLIAFAWISDRIQQKGLITLICMALTCTGFIILLSTTNTVALVVGACFVSAGAYPQLVVSIAWSLTFHGGYTKRALSIWIVSLCSKNLDRNIC